MKPYYSEFVRHCLRYYIKTLDEGRGGCPVFRTPAERENWSACHYVLNGCSENIVDTICQIYRTGDTIPDNIYMIAKNRGGSQAPLWNLVSDIERKIAQKRGLI